MQDVLAEEPAEQQRGEDCEERDEVQSARAQAGGLIGEQRGEHDGCQQEERMTFASLHAAGIEAEASKLRRYRLTCRTAREP